MIRFDLNPLQSRDLEQKGGNKMAFLAGKRVLITGLLSNRSIAYGVAKAARREGAELAFTYQNERFKDRVTEMAGEFGSTLVFPCDVASDAEIAALFSELARKWTALDGLVHAIAFAPREAITGDFLEGLSREAFRVAHDVSSYSFAALAKAALPLMQGRTGALVTLTTSEPTGWFRATTPWASPRRASRPA